VIAIIIKGLSGLPSPPLSPPPFFLCLFLLIDRALVPPLLAHLREGLIIPFRKTPTTRKRHSWLVFSRHRTTIADYC
jgi:hypothetical protein